MNNHDTYVAVAFAVIAAAIMLSAVIMDLLDLREDRRQDEAERRILRGPWV